MQAQAIGRSNKGARYAVLHAMVIPYHRAPGALAVGAVSLFHRGVCHEGTLRSLMDCRGVGGRKHAVLQTAMPGNDRLEKFRHRRHARACRGHPRLACCSATKTWMPGIKPGMTRGCDKGVRQCPPKRDARDKPGHDDERTWLATTKRSGPTTGANRRA